MLSSSANETNDRLIYLEKFGYVNLYPKSNLPVFLFIHSFIILYVETKYVTKSSR